MFLKNSRYRDAAAFQADEDGVVPFRGIRARNIGPASGVMEHTVTGYGGPRADQANQAVMNRHDSLAYHYYANDRLWWRILDANRSFVFARDLLDQDMTGDVILIPRAKE